MRHDWKREKQDFSTIFKDVPAERSQIFLSYKLRSVLGPDLDFNPSLRAKFIFLGVDTWAVTANNRVFVLMRSKWWVRFAVVVGCFLATPKFWSWFSKDRIRDATQVYNKPSLVWYGFEFKSRDVRTLSKFIHAYSELLQKRPNSSSSKP